MICLSRISASQDNAIHLRREEVGNKLYVGSLPYSITEEKLTELFAPHGTVESAKIISDKYSGQSKGFGFVEMSNSEEAASAISALNGKEFEGRTLVVSEARPQEKRSSSSRPGGGGGYRGAGGGRSGGGGGGRW